MENNEVLRDTTPEETKEFTVPIKFNKETRKLSLEEASNLAQKGLKFEAIENDYKAIKDLAAKENKSVPEFISSLCLNQNEAKKQNLKELCGGNEEMAEHILKLENLREKDMGFEELKAAFPKITSIEDLPESVTENARLKGTLLLDEYLRYRLSEQKKARETTLKQKENMLSSTGSLKGLENSLNPEAEEFLRGLWG